jgi:hypothetical protein
LDGHRFFNQNLQRLSSEPIHGITITGYLHKR